MASDGFQTHIFPLLIALPGFLLSQHQHFMNMEITWALAVSVFAMRLNLQLWSLFFCSLLPVATAIIFCSPKVSKSNGFCAHTSRSFLHLVLPSTIAGMSCYWLKSCRQKKSPIEKRSFYSSRIEILMWDERIWLARWFKISGRDERTRKIPVNWLVSSD